MATQPFINMTVCHVNNQITVLSGQCCLATSLVAHILHKGERRVNVNEVIMW